MSRSIPRRPNQGRVVLFHPRLPDFNHGQTGEVTEFFSRTAKFSSRTAKDAFSVKLDDGTHGFFTRDELFFPSDPQGYNQYCWSGVGLRGFKVRLKRDFTAFGKPLGRVYRVLDEPVGRGRLTLVAQTHPRCHPPVALEVPFDDLFPAAPPFTATGSVAQTMAEHAALQ